MTNSEQKEPFPKTSMKRFNIFIGISFFVLFIAIVALISGINSGEFKNNVKKLFNNSEEDKTVIVEEEDNNTNEIVLEEETYKVVDIVDGDTIKADINGKVQTIRLIGIDTPELGNSKNSADCYANEAKDEAEKILLDKFVELKPDETQNDLDRYGRQLRYVYIESLDFNKYMVEEGFAKEYTYDKPYMNGQDYKLAQQSAKNQNKGLWGECIK